MTVTLFRTVPASRFGHRCPRNVDRDVLGTNPSAVHVGNPTHINRVVDPVALYALAEGLRSFPTKSKLHTLAANTIQTLNLHEWGHGRLQISAVPVEPATLRPTQRPPSHGELFGLQDRRSVSEQ